MLVALATMLLGGAGIAQAASKVSPAYDEFGVPTLIVNGTHAYATETAIENDGSPGEIQALAGSTFNVTVALTSPDIDHDIVSYVDLDLTCLGTGEQVVTSAVAVTVPGQPDPTNPAVPVYVNGAITIPSDCFHDGSYSFDGWVDANSGPAPDNMEASDGQFFQISADGTLPGPSLPVAGAVGVVALWRAVDPTELDVLRSKGSYEIPYGGTEGKYFFPTQAQAASFAQDMSAMKGVTYTVTSAQIDADALSGAEAGSALAEGGWYFIRSHLIESVELLKIFD